jgi:hypothetical protein
LPCAPSTASANRSDTSIMRSAILLISANIPPRRHS